MPRASTRVDLINMANDQFEKIFKLINSMTKEEQEKKFNFDEKLLAKEAHWNRDRNLRDVLVHLYEWHSLLINWENKNVGGILTPFLPAKYTWKTYGEMNLEFFNNHQNTPLETAKALLMQSHKDVINIIKKYNDKELFTKAFFKWTGTSSLGQYCISATISHYDWAIKKIKMSNK